MRMVVRCILLLIFAFVAVTLSKNIQETSETSGTSEDNDEASGETEIQEATSKRDGGITAAIVGGAISAGSTLASTTASGMMKDSYSVAVSGTIENYSKWPMRLSRKGCTIMRGQVNVPMKTIEPGFKEGFASHKTGHSATGSWVFCPYIVNDKYRVGIMYSAPYDFNLHSNTLAVAICHTSKSNCKALDGYALYYIEIDKVQADNHYIRNLSDEDKKYGDSEIAIDRQEYYGTIRSVKACLEELCIMGTMGSAHHQKIFIKLMPTKYEDLSSSVQSASKKESWNKDAYEKFVEKEK